MEPDSLQIDNDREWIQWFIEDEEFLGREYQWWRDNELLAAEMRKKPKDVLVKSSEAQALESLCVSTLGAGRVSLGLSPPTNGIS